MANKLHRLVTPLLDSSKPKLGLGFRNEETLLTIRTLSSSSSSSSSTEGQLPPKKLNEGIPQKEKVDRSQQEEKKTEEDDDDDGGGVFVNKATGEVGGPRGPEPTRYGDWERAGRCSDF